VVVYFAYLFLISYGRYFALESAWPIDLAGLNQTVWSLSQGKGFTQTLIGEPNLLGHHAFFILPFLVPLHLLWPAPGALLLFQSFCGAVGLIPAYLLGRHLRINGWFCVMLLICFPLRLTIQADDFRPVICAFPFLLLGIHGTIAHRYRLAGIGFAIAVLCKETVALTVLFWALCLLLFSPGRRRFAGLLALLVGTYLLTYLLLLRPSLLSGSLSLTPPGVLQVYAQSLADGTWLASGNHIHIGRQVLASLPVLLLACLSPLVLAGAIPAIAADLFFPGLLGHPYYLSNATPFLFAGALLGVRRLAWWLVERRQSRRQWPAIIIVGCTLICIVLTTCSSSRPTHHLGNGLRSVCGSHRLAEVASRLPREGLVCSTPRYIAHLSSRSQLQVLPTHGQEVDAQLNQCHQDDAELFVLGKDELGLVTGVVTEVREAFTVDPPEIEVLVLERRQQEAVKRRNDAGLNLLVISIDALRPDHLGCYGYERQTSPHIDRLAARGVVFERAYATASWTGPSMASFFASQLPGSLCVQSFEPPANQLSPAAVMISETLQDRGYRTGFFSNHGAISAMSWTTRGWDLCVDDGDVSAGDLCEQARVWIEENRAPSFTWIHLIEPHTPYHPPRRFADLFRDRSEELESQRERYSWQRQRTWQLLQGSQQPDDDEFDFHISQYDGEIAYTDHVIGQLIGRFDRMGLMSNTVVVVTADHGEGLGERSFYFEHGECLYDFLLRIPLILVAPGVEPGRLPSLVSAVDLSPTLVDFASAPPPEIWIGQSLIPLLRRDQTEVRTYLVSELPQLYQRTVRDHRWKLIVTRDGESRRLELYDLVSDPLELHNLALLQPAVVGRLERQLEGSMPLPGACPDLVIGGELPATIRARLEQLGYLE
jgi:arylsulfatase A-like enzyme/uncharacterized membrane protein